MTFITLKVLDGADRGRVYQQIPTPVTIGREEGNSVQLNDERISRFHIKIQEDQDKVVLTDLESTNGTRVNGEETQLRILRYGDVIHVGRSILLYGSRDQIAGRLDELRAKGLAVADSADLDELSRSAHATNSGEFDSAWADSEQLRSTLHIPSTPELPAGLSPGQAAQLSELLEYLHLRSRDLVHDIHVDHDGNSVVLTADQWQDLLDLRALLSEYLRKIGEPESE